MLIMMSVLYCVYVLTAVPDVVGKLVNTCEVLKAVTGVAEKLVNRFSIVMVVPGMVEKYIIIVRLST